MYESQRQQAQQQDDKHHHRHFQQQLIQVTQPEPNTYDYASQLMFDANAFASMNHHHDSHHHHHPMDLNSAAAAAHVAAQQQAHAQAAAAAQQTGSYLDFLPTNSSNNDPYEMFRYQTAIQQSGSDYTSASYRQQQQATYPMMAFHTMSSQHDHLSSLENSNYPIPYDHHNYMFQNGQGGPMPTLSTSSSSSSSLSSTNTSSTAAYNNDNRGAQVYVRKACVSCKQSHVACDVQRPCARCVRLNKADTCVDAERKKRGRPCGSSKKKKENALMVNGGGMSTATTASALTANMMSYL